jgi:hypothetical protein
MADIYKIEQNGGGRFTVFERDGSRWELERPDRDESFKLSKDGSTFFITERDDGIIKKQIYTDSNKDGIFELSDIRAVGGRPGKREESYKVDRISGGKIRVYERERGGWDLEKPSRNERFKLSKDGTTFKKIERDREGIETYIYKDGNGDGIFDFVTVRFQAADASSRQRRSTQGFDARDLIPPADTLL